jgi:type II secretory pathway pseudopilin PulG
MNRIKFNNPISASNKRGFLLVEMLVAVFLFTIIMLISITAVLSLVEVNRKNQSIKSVVNNLTLVASSLAKNIAVSTKYYCGEPSSEYPGDKDDPQSFTGADAECNGDTSDQITMKYNEDADGDGEDDIYSYKYIETGQDENGSYGSIYRKINNGSFVAMTAPEVKVTRLSFYIANTEPLLVPILGGDATGDAKQPRVTMVVSGYAGDKPNTQSRFNIQTTISQRSLDVFYID